MTAVRIPGPVADDQVDLGMHRVDVEGKLHQVKRNEFPEGEGTSVRYEYKNGPHQASKARVVIYLAGDVLTLSLTELVFWPIEAYASSRADRVATAYYDAQNRLQMWKITRRGGSDVLVSKGAIPIPVIANAAEDRASPPPVSANAVDGAGVGVDPTKSEVVVAPLPGQAESAMEGSVDDESLNEAESIDDGDGSREGARNPIPNLATEPS